MAALRTPPPVRVPRRGQPALASRIGTRWAARYSLLLVGLATALVRVPSAHAIYPDEVEVPCTEPVVVDLVASLEHADPSVREVAAHQLKQCPELAADHGAVALLAVLAGGDPVTEVREEALWTLAEIGPPALEDARTALVELVDMQREAPPGYVRGAAAYALGRMQLPSEEAGPVLLPLLLDFDEFTRRSAADAIGQLGEPMIPLLLVTLAQMEGPLYRAGVVDALGAMGEAAASTVPVLEELAASTSSTMVRSSVDRALVLIQPAEVGDRVQRLLDEMEGGRDSTRYLDIVDLGKIGPDAVAAMPVLLASLEDPHTARVAAEALVQVSPIHRWPDVARSMAPLLAIDSWEGRQIATSLAQLGGPGQVALERALEGGGAVEVRHALHGLAMLEASPGTFKPGKRLLHSDDPETRTGAARLLATHGDRALPTLERAIRREQAPLLRADLIRALAPLGESALPLWREGLGHTDATVRDAAAHQIGQLGAAGAPAAWDLLRAGAGGSGMSEPTRSLGEIGATAVPALEEALESGDAPLRGRAAYAAGLVGPDALELVPALARALDDDDEHVRQWAAWSLGLIGPGAAGAVEDLRAALTDPENWVRGNAAQALGQIGEAARPAVPDLIALVEHDRALTPPEKAAEALGALGAVEAVDPLAHALDSDNDYVRRAAAKAILAIGRVTPLVLERLRDGLDDDRARVRWACADALIALGEESDRVRAMIVRQKAPDEAWDEDLAAMGRMNAMFDEIMEVPEPVEGD